MTIEVPIREHCDESGSPPAGVVTFVMTDVGGSTPLWLKDRDAMARALVRNDELVLQVFTTHGGTVLKARGEGDSVFAVFGEASKALEAAAAVQVELARDELTSGTPIRLRIAVHSGEDYLALPGDYRGNTPNRCARIRETAHPGQVLASQAACVLAREKLSESLGLRPIGTHLLRDLVLPEPLFQLVGSGLPEDFPPPRSLTNHPHNLPIQLTSFIGRAGEIDAVCSALARTRLLTLWGTGGCGKTRLALQVAAQAFDRYEKGVWMVDLSTIVDSEEVAAHMVRELGVLDPLGREPAAAISEHFGADEALIVLDNCEHVAKGVADAILYLLQRSPAVTVLATSRQPLDIPGETTYAVPGMSLPERAAATDLALVAQHDGVRLFVERATARDRSFALVDSNAPDVAQLCHMLDGLPFLIELAAAGTHLMTPKQMREDIGRVLHRKGGRGAGAVQRHETLEATLQWSYDLLSAEARHMLACLAVFVGSWTLEAAEEVHCGGAPLSENLFDTLDELVRDSLVHSETGPGETRRFRLLETTRRFAAARPVDRDELAHRHYAHYLGLALRTWDEWFMVAQASLSALLDVDYPNIAAALNWGYARGDARLPEFARSLTEYWMLRGKLKIGRDWLEKCDGYPGQDQMSRAWTLNALGAMCLRQGDYARADGAFKEALAVFQGAGATVDAAIVFSNLAIVSSHLGDWVRARTHLDESRRAFEKAGEHHFLIRALINLGVLDLDTGKWDDEVCAIFTQAAEAAAGADDAAMAAVADGNLGETFLRMERPSEAIGPLKRAFAVWESFADPTEIATSLIDVARLCAQAHFEAEALHVVGLSDALFAEAGSKLTERQASARSALLDSVRGGHSLREPVRATARGNPPEPASVAAEALGLLKKVEAAVGPPVGG